MYPKKVIQDTAKVLQSYLTYQAVRTILEQLAETNPTQAIWLSQYSERHRIQDSDDYLSGLMTENKELLLRILTVRQDLAGSILEFLPEMVATDIDKSNMEYRRQLLERLTQSGSIDSNRSTENVDTDLDRPA
jgi:hypothetical protein